MPRTEAIITGARVEYRGTTYTVEDAVMLGLIYPPGTPEDSLLEAEEVPGETATDQPGNTEPGDAIAKGSRGTRR